MNCLDMSSEGDNIPRMENITMFKFVELSDEGHVVTIHVEFGEESGDQTWLFTPTEYEFPCRCGA